MNQTSETPNSINVLGYLAIALLLLLPLSVLTVRSGAFQQGLALYALACLGSALLLIVLILFLLHPKYTEHRAGLRTKALLTVPGTIALLSLTLSGDHPRIHDITTDTNDPPRFVAAAEQRGEDANSLDIKPDSIAEQLRAYPDLTTVRTTMTIDQAYSQALTVAGELGWEVYHEDRSAGIIEAVDTTLIMAFKDDIVIRVRGNAEGAYLDLRSVSRVGLGDLGANAKRIRSFVAAFNGQ